MTTRLFTFECSIEVSPCYSITIINRPCLNQALVIRSTKIQHRFVKGCDKVVNLKCNVFLCENNVKNMVHLTGNVVEMGDIRSFIQCHHYYTIVLFCVFCDTRVITLFLMHSRSVKACHLTISRITSRELYRIHKVTARMLR